MTNLRSRLEAAAFWGGYACVACREVLEEAEAEGAGHTCEECGGHLTLASEVFALVKAVEEDET